jgi:GSH-dependent disulfide-bond oxidoreductase
VIHLYYWPTPNGHKASIALEELGLRYRVHPVNILRGEQFEPGFLALSPNNKIPALVDTRGPADRRLALFESGAILQYLADKTGRLLPKRGSSRYEALAWLAFQLASVGPMFGQCGHFLGYAPRRIRYAIDRYRNETLRLYSVMNCRLADVEFLGGDYSIADIATWPWVDVRWLHEIDLDEFPHVKRWYETIAARPAVRRGMALLADRMKIGDPDETTREVFFGATQRTQGRRVGLGSPRVRRTRSVPR